MSSERPQINKPFSLTEHERLFDAISHQRFLSLIAAPPTIVHGIEDTGNSYGEFLFVTLSYPNNERRIVQTFYGLGFHEYRERWITDHWRWYDNHESTAREVLQQVIPKAEAERRIQERFDWATTNAVAEPGTQSVRGKLYEFLAELEDEDGAITDLEDFGDWLLGDE